MRIVLVIMFSADVCVPSADSVHSELLSLSEIFSNHSKIRLFADAVSLSHINGKF